MCTIWMCSICQFRTLACFWRRINNILYCTITVLVITIVRKILFTCTSFGRHFWFSFRYCNYRIIEYLHDGMKIVFVISSVSERNKEIQLSFLWFLICSSNETSFCLMCVQFSHLIFTSSAWTGINRYLNGVWMHPIPIPHNENSNLNYAEKQNKNEFRSHQCSFEIIEKIIVYLHFLLFLPRLTEHET